MLGLFTLPLIHLSSEGLTCFHRILPDLDIPIIDDRRALLASPLTETRLESELFWIRVECSISLESCHDEVRESLATGSTGTDFYCFWLHYYLIL